MPDSVDSEWSTVSGPTMSLLPYTPQYLSGDPTYRDDESKSDTSHCKHTGSPETVAIERLVKLKKELRAQDLESFWSQLVEQTASICHAQYSFVARRVVPDESGKGIRGKSPQLLGTAFYFNDGCKNVGLHRHRYFAGGNPLSHMDRAEPCLIPEKLSSFISSDRDTLPFSPEGYLAIPLFSGTQCLAYLGLMWSESGLQKRNLSWSFLRMILFSLEDLIVPRLHEDIQATEKDVLSDEARETALTHKIDDSEHPTILQGGMDFPVQHLKPFARSLSHELRTPMQGIVGMLDVMHATVREAIQGKPSPRTAYVFQSLKESIEMVQDSARRAVEAADNVVHAYDLNMQIPKTPQFERENDFFGGPVKSPVTTAEGRPTLFIEGSDIPVNPYKRRRSISSEWNVGMIPKSKVSRVTQEHELSPRTEEVKNAVHESEKIVHATPAHQIEAVMANMVDPRPSLAVRRSAPHLLLEGINFNIKGSALRFTKLRDLLRLIINESLHVGGRPDFVVSNVTELGEKIEVRTRSSNGEVFSKTINWSVEPTVPDTLLVDDRDLAKLISCVFLNAVKFTNSGVISVNAKLSQKGNDIMISVQDTGPGIPDAFLPSLFKPFTREDSSTTRSKDGLGLGLLVAKGLSRKMGGDLACVRSSTSGPDRGSEFEIRVPLNEAEPTHSVVSAATRLQISPHLRDSSKISRPVLEPSLLSPSPSILTPHPPVQQPTPGLTDESSSNTPTPARSLPQSRPYRGSASADTYDSKLGEKYPLTFLVADDNKINRRVLVHMLKRLGYQEIYEACNGKEAVRTMRQVMESQWSDGAMDDPRRSRDCQNELDDFLIPDPPNGQKKLKPVDVVLMDLWMPEMDGYEATTKILQMADEYLGQNGQMAQNLQGSTCEPAPTTSQPQSPTVLAVSADVTDEALSRASKVGIKGYMTKPYKLIDLERLIMGFCSDTGRQYNDTTNT